VPTLSVGGGEHLFWEGNEAQYEILQLGQYMWIDTSLSW
jgi:hypothetical protein